MKVNTIGWNTGVDFNAGSLPTDPKVLAGIKSQLKGHLVAWDPVAQKEVWRAQFDHPWNGGALSTAGNLVFEGNSNGEFTAYRANDGQKLWSAPTQAGVMAGPMSYEIDGEQYVAIEVGGAAAFGLAAGELARDSHLAANIPARAGLQDRRNGQAAGSAGRRGTCGEPPAEIGNEAVWTAGKAVFHTNCSVCHWRFGGERRRAAGPAAVAHHARSGWLGAYRARRRAQLARHGVLRRRSFRGRQ
jgi:hypothetical protein